MACDMFNYNDEDKDITMYGDGDDDDIDNSDVDVDMDMEDVYTDSDTAETDSQSNTICSTSTSTNAASKSAKGGGGSGSGGGGGRASSKSTSAKKYKTKKVPSKREHHNELERRRRHQIKSCFQELSERIPTLKGTKTSRAQVLLHAKTYNLSTEKEIEELRKENESLEASLKTINEKIKLAKERRSRKTVSEVETFGATDSLVSTPAKAKPTATVTASSASASSSPTLAAGSRSILMTDFNFEDYCSFDSGIEGSDAGSLHRYPSLLDPPSSMGFTDDIFQASSVDLECSFGHLLSPRLEYYEPDMFLFDKQSSSPFLSGLDSLADSELFSFNGTRSDSVLQD